MAGGRKVERMGIGASCWSPDVRRRVHSTAQRTRPVTMYVHICGDRGSGDKTRCNQFARNLRAIFNLCANCASRCNQFCIDWQVRPCQWITRAPVDGLPVDRAIHWNVRPLSRWLMQSTLARGLWICACIWTSATEQVDKESEKETGRGKLLQSIPWQLA
jgi:hypothetical protein